MRLVNPRAELLVVLEQPGSLADDELEQVHANGEIRRGHDAEAGALRLFAQSTLVRGPAGGADHRRQLALDAAPEVRAQRVCRRGIDRHTRRPGPVAPPNATPTGN